MLSLQESQWDVQKYFAWSLWHDQLYVSKKWSSNESKWQDITLRSFLPREQVVEETHHQPAIPRLWQEKDPANPAIGQEATKWWIMAVNRLSQATYTLKILYTCSECNLQE